MSNMKTLRVLSRASNLARAQVAEVMRLLGEESWEMITMDSYGDRHKEQSLLEATAEDFFTREIDAALLAGAGDIAIHSAKDLPYPLPAGIALVALTECLDPTDALVTRNGATLASLENAARIGTSSPSRLRQIQAIRPDLQPVSIRGTIEERIAQLHDGSIDALIVASCAMKRLGREEEIAEVLPIAAHDLQGHLAVCARAGRADMRARFHPLDIRTRRGTVYLTGAGTSRDMLTIAADRALAAAEVIVHDDLLDQGMLDNYPGEKIPVGKRGGAQSADQDAINALLYRAACEGKRTVRLKGGDPSLFGRLGEELEYLGRRLITVEVIPGVSSALAAAAGAGFPLTQRGISASVSFTTAQRADGSVPGPEPETCVYYMGAGKRAEIAGRLRESGRHDGTPVALVSDAGTMRERTIITDIAHMAEADTASPVIIVAGDVVGRRYAQERYLFTGLEPEHSSVRVPGRVVHYPLIRIVELPDAEDVHPAAFDAVVFTSRNAVRIFMKRHHRLPPHVFSVGQATAAALRAYGISSESPPRANADSLAAMLRTSPYRSILYPSSAISANAVHALETVRRIDCYTTEPLAQPRLDLNSFAGVVFTAPSTVRAFHAVYGAFPEHLVYYAIGPVTVLELIHHQVPQEIIIDVQKIQGTQV